jgi:hypothetical protein
MLVNGVLCLLHLFVLSNSTAGVAFTPNSFPSAAFGVSLVFSPFTFGCLY